LVTLVSPAKLASLWSRSYQVSFFHERGPWWAENDWARVHATYQARIERFREGIRNRRRLYIYCLCSPVDLARLIKAYEVYLDDHSARLLIVSVLKERIAFNTETSKIKFWNFPYPEDYSWPDPRCFDSPRGHAFEHDVARAVVDEVAKMISV
jgi:hypothetical protein